MKIFDPRLLDQLHTLQLIMEYNTTPLHVISGYRSPSTNAMLCRRSRGVARDSFPYVRYGHRHPHAGPRHGRLTAGSAIAPGGGVGYYRRSNFVHVDTGPIRTWAY